MGEQTRVAYLLPLRLFCGWVFLSSSLSQLVDGTLAGPALRDTITTWLREGRPYHFYAPFLRDVVVPHAAGFATAVSFGDLLVGAALLAGLFTRAAALGGILLVVNFILARGDSLAANETVPLFVLLVTALLTNPGRALGLDAALRGRVPSWLS